MTYQEELQMQEDIINLFREPLTKVFVKYFPHSAFHVGKGPLGSVFVSMTLGAKGEYENGIMHNDPVRCSGGIYLHQKGFELDFKPYVGSLKSTNPFMAQRSEKVEGVRVLRCDKDKLISGFEKIIAKLASKVKELAEQDKFLKLPFDPLSKINS